MENQRQQSEFNMAVSYLGRLNTLFYVADEAAIGLDIHSWFHTLITLYRELSTEMKDAEIKEMDNRVSSINNKIQSYNRRNKRIPNKGIDSELYQDLHSFEMSLRKVLKEAGLQTAIKDDAAKALK
jgi:hypothetical protein